MSDLLQDRNLKSVLSIRDTSSSATQRYTCPVDRQATLTAATLRSISGTIGFTLRLTGPNGTNPIDLIAVAGGSDFGQGGEEMRYHLNAGDRAEWTQQGTGAGEVHITMHLREWSLRT